jgi:hypothetical protein
MHRLVLLKLLLAAAIACPAPPTTFFPGGTGGGDGGGDGNGPPSGAAIETEFPIATLFADPNDANRIFVVEQDPGVMRLSTVDFQANSTTLLYDFAADGVQRQVPSLFLCEVDNFTRQPGFALPLNVGEPTSDEMWFACRNETDVLVVYPSGGLQLDVDLPSRLPEVAGFDLSLTIGDAKRPGDLTLDRRLFAKRGGQKIYGLNTETNAIRQPQPGADVERASDNIDIDFNGIVSMTLFAAENANLAQQPGEVVVVFDGGARPRLVPIQRDASSDNSDGDPWSELDSFGFEPLELPLGTVAVDFTATTTDITQFVATTGNDPNDNIDLRIIVLGDDGGYVYTFSYAWLLQKASEGPLDFDALQQQTNFVRSIFEDDPTFIPNTPRDPTERLHFRRDGEVYSLVLPSTGVGWRFPRPQAGLDAIQASATEYLQFTDRSLPTFEDVILTANAAYVTFDSDNRAFSRGIQRFGFAANQPPPP